MLAVDFECPVPPFDDEVTLVADTASVLTKET
jgi:hypothetical protein